MSSLYSYAVRSRGYAYNGASLYVAYNHTGPASDHAGPIPGCQNSGVRRLSNMCILPTLIFKKTWALLSTATCPIITVTMVTSHFIDIVSWDTTCGKGQRELEQIQKQVGNK